MDATTYAVDCAKNVMQVHWVDAQSGEIQKRKLSRAKFVELMSRRQAGRVAMEACGGAHHWARTLMTMGHEVELLPARQVRAFVRGNKDDAADARAIWLAAQHGDIRRVPVKTVQQQAVLALHRMRTHWVSVSTATVNALRGLLYEFGVVLPKGKTLGLKTLAAKRAEFDALLPALMQQMLDVQLAALREVQQRVDELEAQLQAVNKTDAVARKLRQMPGIGLLGATALAGVLGDGARAASGWRNAREFACNLGLTPRHTGTGGKVTMGGINKRGDPYLRTLLVAGARSVVHGPNAPQWVRQLLQRRPSNVVVVALANKLARTAWALVAHQRDYDPQHSKGAAESAVPA